MTPADLLAFEAAHPMPFGPTKNDAIRRELGITPSRYVVLLARAAGSAEGMAADPLTARRVRDRASARACARAARSAHILPTVADAQRRLSVAVGGS